MQKLPASRLHVQEQADGQQTTNADVVSYGVALISDECRERRHAQQKAALILSLGRVESLHALIVSVCPSVTTGRLSFKFFSHKN